MSQFETDAAAQQRDDQPKSEIAIDMSGNATPAEIEAAAERVDAIQFNELGLNAGSPVFAAAAVMMTLDAIHDSPHPLRLLECFEEICQGYRAVIARGAQPTPALQH